MDYTKKFKTWKRNRIVVTGIFGFIFWLLTLILKDLTWASGVGVVAVLLSLLGGMNYDWHKFILNPGILFFITLGACIFTEGAISGLIVGLEIISIYNCGRYFQLYFRDDPAVEYGLKSTEVDIDHYDHQKMYNRKRRKHRRNNKFHKNY